MERFSNSTVVACASIAATSNGSSTLMSCVSSRANRMAVNGARIVPPRIAPMLTSGQKPAPSCGRNPASTPPSAAPIISSGASTPPDVPDPSEIIQIADFTSSTPAITLPGTSPCNRDWIVS